MRAARAESDNEDCSSQRGHGRSRSLVESKKKKPKQTDLQGQAVVGAGRASGLPRVVATEILLKKGLGSYKLKRVG